MLIGSSWTTREKYYKLDLEQGLQWQLQCGICHFELPYFMSKCPQYKNSCGAYSKVLLGYSKNTAIHKKPYITVQLILSSVWKDMH